MSALPTTAPSAAKKYSRRLFLTYQELVEGSGRNLDAAVDRYRAKNKRADLDQLLTFAEWYAENETLSYRK